MGLDGSRFWRFYVGSAAACVDVSIGSRLGNFLCTRKSCVMLETHSDAVLVMYDIRH